MDLNSINSWELDKVLKPEENDEIISHAKLWHFLLPGSEFAGFPFPLVKILADQQQPLGSCSGRFKLACQGLSCRWHRIAHAQYERQFHVLLDFDVERHQEPN